MRNYVQLIGHCGGAPEMRETSTGKQTARLSVATNNNYTDEKGERVEFTTWHRIIGWNRVAELMVDKLTKGSKVLVEGAIQYRKYEDDQGITRNYAEVIAKRFMAL